MDLDKFAGGDQRYLRDVQYKDSRNLTARASLHVKYGTAPKAWFPWVVAQIDWGHGVHVLEVGCGPGWLWTEAADDLPPGLRLTLTDLSPGMVQSAAERVRGVPQISLVDAREADAQDLPFEASSFDVVVANHMLYHLPDPARGVAELARVCRADGVLLATTSGANHLRELGEIRAAVFGGPVVHATVVAFGIETGEPILRTYFEEVEWRPFEDELLCTDPDDVQAFIMSTPPGEDATPQQSDAIRSLIDARFVDGDGVFRVTKETGTFVARGPKET